MDVIVAKDLTELPAVAEHILKAFEGKRIFAFQGLMGAGKTTLIKELCRQMNVVDVVSSPTFALVNEYFTDKGSSVFHFDFYRIQSVEEAFDFGYEEYFFGEGICLIEWPEVIDTLIPEEAIVIKIEVMQDESRRFSFFVKEMGPPS
ncbi:MAG TPA: tRNA (adenosine(37)-N6)-threonylcarbamoyltransferase complex ATPase subunit type 1 TsaE [Williamwhitmania sp.]|nr:tRNA (adenosine(37)-N6)-threonylcarbamoyltransferase complex ATPase subunit type 1 TsaE [Williamwhitmania sp.]